MSDNNNNNNNFETRGQGARIAGSQQLNESGARITATPPTPPPPPNKK